MYSAEVLDHFEHPRNTGELSDPTATVTVENPACGDILQLTARIESGCIAELRFKAKGCVTSVACASRMTELVTGRNISEARHVTAEQIAAALGGLSRETIHASHLAADAVTQLLQKARST